MSILFRRRPHAGLVGVALLFCALSVSAAQPQALGEVTVQSTGESGFAEAMRTVLVRLTGRRTAANDPVLAPLVRDARRYVQIVRPATASSAPRITLDAAAIERSLLALEQPVWARERPLVLGVIATAPAGADAAATRAALESAAFERGLPLRLMSASSAGFTAGGSVDASAALAAARRAGADVALLGEADGTEWQWTLFDGVAPAVFTGSVTAGIEGAADTLAIGAQAAIAQAVESATVRVVGIATLQDYAEVQRMLAGLLGVRAVGVRAVESDSALFEVQLPGGAQGLQSALAGSAKLRRDSVSAATPTYRLQR
ncbi:MAG: DUF2066 domain-containing protein [Nevskiaceae bacterium]